MTHTIRRIDEKTYYQITYPEGVAFYYREKKAIFFFHSVSVVSDNQLQEAVNEYDSCLELSYVPSQPKNPYTMPNVELLLTDKCQLACTYCYSDASLRKKTMSSDRIRSAIDMVFRNAGLRKLFSARENCVHIGFTGGGEPTCEMDLLVEAIEYAQRKSGKTGIMFDWSLQTNGQCGKDNARLLAELGCSSISLSMDGVKSVQDRQRPRVDGLSSFDFCTEFIDEISRFGISIAIRSTLTKRSSAAFLDFVKLVDAQYPNINYIQVEPMSITGRGCNEKDQQPSVEEMYKIIAEARAMDLEHTRVSNHNMRLDRYGSYCGSADFGTTIYVSTSNYISACQECTTPNATLGCKHIVGEYDHNDPIICDIEKVYRWNEVKESKQCKDCIALFVCAGGCRAKMDTQQGKTIKNERSLYWCSLTKELIKLEIHDCIFTSHHYQNSRVLNETSRDKLTVLQI